MADIKVKQVTRNIIVHMVGRRGPKGEQGEDGNASNAPVQSVNGETGVVVLSASDVGADPAGSAATAQANATSYTDNEIAAIDFPVDSVNAQTGAVVLDQDDVADGSTYKQYSATEKTKLAGIEAGAQVNTVTSVASKTGDVSLTKGDVGLANVDNTTDANKPVSTAQQAALDLKLNTSLKGTANGVAELDGTGTVPTAQLPAFVDEVIEVANYAALPGTGDTGKIYVTLDDGKTYRWSGTVYVEISSSLALGETNSTAYRGDRGKIAYDHSQLTSGNPHAVTKSDVGLGNADDTSDVDKPISTATQTALDTKVDENASITGATRTKITYDSKGLVTAGANATQDDIGDGTNFKQYSAADKTKLAGIEAGADVTDTANVDAAGALMESEVDADIKTLSLPASTTISTFGASLVDDAAASNARTTLGLVIGTDVISPTSTNTLTNKTIDADSNTLSNIDTTEIKASALVTEAEGLNSSDNDTSWPTTAAVKDYVDDGIATIPSGDSRQYKMFVTVGSEDADYITDGIDDHIQIQEAVDDLSTANGGLGGTIFIKDGTYDIGRRIVILSSDMTIRGAGMSTKLVLADDVDQEIFVIGNGRADDPDVDDPLGDANFIPYVAFGEIIDCNNVNFYDMYLDGNKANQYQGTFSDIRYGVSATRNLIRYRSDNLNSYGADIQNVMFYNGVQNGLSIESHKRMTVAHIRCEANRIFGIWGESGGRWNLGPGIFTADNEQQGIKIFGSGMCNIVGWVSEKDQGGISVQSTDRLQVTNFVIRDAGYNSAAKSAITLAASVSECIFSDGNIQSTWGDAIEIYGDGNGGYNKFSDITIKATGQLTTNTYSDIHFKSSGAGRSKNNRFSRISSTSTTANVPAYALDDDTGGHTNNTFRDCQFVAPYGTAVNGLTSIDNQFFNCTGIPNVTTKTADYTATYADEVILVDASGGARTVYLPLTLTPNARFTVKKIDSSSNGVTVHGNGVNIDGSTTKGLLHQYQTITVVNNATQWYTIDLRADVSGPAASTDNTLTRWDGTSGKVVQESSAILTDGGALGLGITPVSMAHIYQNTTDTGTVAGLTIEQNGTGDAVTQYLLTGGRRWVAGVDNSDSDKFKIAANADVGNTSLFQMTTAGVATFTGDVNVPDEVYGVAWNGSTEVPTKNAVYDKIETITSSVVDTANSPATNEFARFTDANTIEGRTAAETKADLDLEVGVDLQAYSANLDEYAAVNPTAAGLALLDDTDAAAQLGTLGLTATAAELNTLDGITATVTELNYTDGVTGAIQTQLDAKVTGPSSATDNRIARYDGTTGELIQDSAVTITDAGVIELGGNIDAKGYDFTDSTGSTTITSGADGGGLDLTANATATTGAGGTVTVSGGDGGTASGAGGKVQYIAGDGRAAGAAGGDLVFQSGDPGSGGAVGEIIMRQGSAGNNAKFVLSGLSAARSFTFPDATTALVGTDTTQTLTNKTLTSPAITTPTGIVKGDVGLGNVDNTSDATKNSASATLTNKTIARSSNTLTGLPICIPFCTQGFNPADATTYYFGGQYGNAANTSSNRARIYVPTAGTIKRIDMIFFNTTTNGTNEASTVSIRINDTTDYTISSAVDNSTNPFVINNTSLNGGSGITVAVGDYFEMKWVTPTWVTNPQTPRIHGMVYIET